MKLGPLNSAIRGRKGAIRIRFNLMNRWPVELEVQKGSLLDGLKAQFPGGKGEETFLTLRDDGFLDLDPAVADQAPAEVRAADREAPTAVDDDPLGLGDVGQVVKAAPGEDLDTFLTDPLEDLI